MIRSLVALLLLTSVASAHEHWINKGGYKNAAGEWCCGVNDCHEVLVLETKDYWVVIDGGQIIPKGRELPSLDGNFWLCIDARTKEVRCFFAPPPPS